MRRAWLVGLLRLLALAPEAPEVLAAPRTKLIGKYYGLKPCDDKENGLRIRNMSLHLDEEGGTLVDVDGSQELPMKVVSKFTVIIWRCRDGTAPNQCEYFTRWSWNSGLCRLLQAKGMVWTPLLESISPPYVCPHTAGRALIIRNATVDMNVVDKALPIGGVEKHIWPFEVQLWNELGQLPMCMKAVAEPRRIIVRKHGRGR